MKDEALKLADELDKYPNPIAVQSTTMIRRLVKELEFQKKANIDLFLENTYSNRTIELLNKELDELNLELGNPIDHEEWGKHQVACKHDVDDGACKECYEEATQTKLSDEEIQTLKIAIEHYICGLQAELTQEQQTFKGYEHCSNIQSLIDELTDADKAKAILERHGIK